MPSSVLGDTHVVGFFFFFSHWPWNNLVCYHPQLMTPGNCSAQKSHTISKTKNQQKAWTLVHPVAIRNMLDKCGFTDLSCLWIIQNILTRAIKPPKPNQTALWCSMELSEGFGKMFLVYSRYLSSKWNHISKFFFWTLAFKKISEMFYGVVHCFKLPRFFSFL